MYKHDKAKGKLVSNGGSFLLDERFDIHTRPIKEQIERILEKSIDCKGEEMESVRSHLTEQQIKQLGICMSDYASSYHKGGQALTNELIEIIQRAPKIRQRSRSVCLPGQQE